jgi:hypothetical protein
VRADHDVVCYIFFLHYLKHRHEDFHSGCARPHGCLLRLCTQAGQPQHCYGQHQQHSAPSALACRTREPGIALLWTRQRP